MNKFPVELPATSSDSCRPFNPPECPDCTCSFGELGRNCSPGCVRMNLWTSMRWVCKNFPAVCEAAAFSGHSCEFWLHFSAPLESRKRLLGRPSRHKEQSLGCSSPAEHRHCFLHFLIMLCCFLLLKPTALSSPERYVFKGSPEN